MKVNKTGIRLMHQNRPFLDGKAVFPNSVLSLKKFHACELNIDIIFGIFANSSFGIQICTFFER